MEEPGTGDCRSCHGTFCARCLVYSFGPKKPPFCVGCALVASGVRNGSRRVHQPAAPAPAAAVPMAFGAAPALFTDDTHGGSGRPPSSPGPSSPGPGATAGVVKASWSHRRAQRQAAKVARRTAQNVAAASAVDGQLVAREAQNVEPILSQNQRQALGRLSASSF